MKVAVIDYGSGNLASARRALERAAAGAGIAAEVLVSADAAVVAGADRIVLPGQGAFAECWAGLAAIGGMRRAIEDRTAAGAPFLGICVGMELMAERGLEHKETPGFGWIKGEIAPIRARGLPLPQMGWNALAFQPEAHPLLAGIVPGQHVYFVHGYALSGADPDEVLASTDYG
ncbi:MAG: imidazole glycerol phosphate synthase subunit HisH, partial [Acetobacteraceae bacterium]